MLRRPSRVALTPAICLALAAGCSSDPGAPADPGPSKSERYRTESAVLFPEDRLLEVQVELDPGDWDVLGGQGRSLDAAACGDTFQSADAPYTYFHAKLTVDGHELPDVGVRKKGFLGSLAVTRPSLKLNLDEYVPGTELSGMSELTLNNNRQDAALVRQCVTYHLFTRAGVPAPRCAFAHVTVNGQDLGTYTHVEAIGKRFLGLHFADDGGNLYEGQGADFEGARLPLFQLKTNESAADRSDLEAMKQALEAADDDLLGALEGHLDVDAYFSYWASESLTGDWDTYSTTRNNFFIYDDPGSGFHFIPWGTDATLSTEGLIPGDPRPQSISASSVLSSRLFALPEGRERYVTRMRELLDGWDETEILAYVDHLAALLPDELETDVESIREFIRGRKAAVGAELDAGPEPLPSRDFCFEAGAPASGTFSTTWAADADTAISAPGATATLELVVDGQPVVLSGLSAVAGNSTVGGAPSGTVRVAGADADGSLVIVQFGIEPLLFGKPEVKFHALADAGFVVRVAPPDLNPNVLGFISDGSIVFDEVGQTEGAAVRGHFSGRFYAARR